MELMADWELGRGSRVIIAFDGRVRFNGWRAGMRGGGGIGSRVEQLWSFTEDAGSQNRELGGKACHGSTINAVTLAQIWATEYRIQCILYDSVCNAMQTWKVGKCKGPSEKGMTSAANVRDSTLNTVNASIGRIPHNSRACRHIKVFNVCLWMENSQNCVAVILYFKILATLSNPTTPDNQVILMDCVDTN